MAPPLSRRLRKETKIAHRLVESTRLARAFFKGKLTKQAYAEGLARMLPVYAAMEEALQGGASDPRLEAFRLPHVFRTEALLEDLSYFGVSPEPARGGASAAYAARIGAAIETSPALLVGHAYVRYMADVSGGIIAGTIAQRVLRLPTRQGLSFLTFPSIPDAGAFRDDFRKRLDAFPRDEDESLAIIGEANVAFELNRRLADELFSDLLS